MEAYIEFVILDNFAVTLLIAVASYRFLHIRYSVWRLLCAAAMGTAAAVVYPLVHWNPFVGVLVKVALGCGLAAILFVGKYRYGRGLAVFMVLTFMFGGLLFCVGLMVHGNVADALSRPLATLPLGVILLGAASLYFLLRRIFLFLHRRKDALKNTSDVAIDILNQHIRTVGFMDTGNRLYDKHTGLPVVVLSVKALLPYLNEQQTMQLMRGEGRALFPDAYYMHCTSLGSTDTKILLVKPQKFFFYNGDKANIVNDVMVGLSFSKMTDAAQYDVILHPALLD